MIEVTVQPAQIDLAVPNEEQIAAGANAIQLNAHLGIPIPGPGGQAVAALPLGVVRIPLVREQALSLAESLKAEAEKLPKQSQILTANSLDGVDKIANFERDLRGN